MVDVLRAWRGDRKPWQGSPWSVVLGVSGQRAVLHKPAGHPFSMRGRPLVARWAASLHDPFSPYFHHLLGPGGKNIFTDIL